MPNNSETTSRTPRRSCENCIFAQPFPRYVHRYKGFCKRPDVSRSQQDPFFFDESTSACRFHLTVAEYIAAKAMRSRRQNAN